MTRSLRQSSPGVRSGGTPGGAAGGRPERVVALSDELPMHRQHAVRPEKGEVIRRLAWPSSQYFVHGEYVLGGGVLREGVCGPRDKSTLP